MIDLHSHFLAGIDDGASTLDDSVAMLRMAEEQGVTQLLATPHIHPGRFDNSIKNIVAAFEALYERVKKERLNLKLGFAAEVRLCPELMPMLANECLPFVGTFQADKKVLLLEFPHTHIPPGTERMVDWLQGKGVLPLLAHPERNQEACELPSVLTPFMQRECMLQLTASSLLGQFGLASEQLAWQLLESGREVVVASDMHNLGKRAPRMKEAYELVSQRLGLAYAQRVFIDLPARLINTNPSVRSVFS
ncbi:tyrosine-protein phosphatase [Agaribacterium haliotis]|uniref:tyrosine-protein phosphatase n=1 Tax=Agaribacterium haliotis TaxID=2013869 RepID=UPI0011779A94|nr:CpsB/CapC family capsule biosynthesis tyrosine phosphatase [Agaribacterium haliotis]